jgi:hypothetical protein
MLQSQQKTKYVQQVEEDQTFKLNDQTISKFYNFLNNLAIPSSNLFSNQESFNSLIFFLKSLTLSSISWKNLLDGVSFSFVNLNNEQLEYLKNLKNSFKSFGFEVALSHIKNTFVLSIKLNLNKEQKKELENLLIQGKTPFNIMQNPFFDSSTQSNAFVPPYVPQISTFAQTKLPVGISFSNEQNKPPLWPISTTSNSVFNYIFSVDSILNILEGKAEWNDYFNVCLDVVSVVGLSVAFKFGKKALNSLKEFLGAASKSENFKSLSFLQKSIVFSKHQEITIALKEGQKFDKVLDDVLKSFSKEVPKSKIPQIFKNTTKITTKEGEELFINKNGSVIGFFKDEKYFKLTKPIGFYFSSALNAIFYGYIGNTVYESISILVNEDKILDYIKNLNLPYSHLPEEEKKNFEENLKQKIIHSNFRTLGLIFSSFYAIGWTGAQIETYLTKWFSSLKMGKSANEVLDIAIKDIQNSKSIKLDDNFINNFLSPLINNLKLIENTITSEKFQLILRKSLSFGSVITLFHFSDNLISKSTETIMQNNNQKNASITSKENIKDSNNFELAYNVWAILPNKFLLLENVSDNLLSKLPFYKLVLKELGVSDGSIDVNALTRKLEVDINSFLVFLNKFESSEDFWKKVFKKADELSKGNNKNYVENCIDAIKILYNNGW